MVAHSRVHEQKRHGRHQKYTKHFVKVYWPYLPLLVIVSFGLAFNSYWQPRSRSGILPYATSMSINQLLAQTNVERAKNGKAALTINNQLDQAAQAKANDMVARNYWSHNTPDGQPPWVFIDKAGYKYQKAGENLAYGFLTSDDTVAGWMNSPPHKENLLDSTYLDVGFGFANSPNYQSNGPETVVVAMYGYALGASTPPPAPVAQASPPQATPAPQPPKSAPIAQNVPAPTPAPPAPVEVKPPSQADTQQKTAPQPVTTQQAKISDPPNKKVSRIAAFTRGSTPWLTSSISMITVVGVAVLALKHGLALRRFITSGERFIIRHALFDVTILSLIGLSIILTRTAGVIR